MWRPSVIVPQFLFPADPQTSFNVSLTSPVWPFLEDLGCGKSHCSLHFPQHFYSGEFWIIWERVREEGWGGGRGRITGIPGSVGARGLANEGGIFPSTQIKSCGTFESQVPVLHSSHLGTNTRVPHLRSCPFRLLCPRDTLVVDVFFLLSPSQPENASQSSALRQSLSTSLFQGWCQKQAYVELDIPLPCLCAGCHRLQFRRLWKFLESLLENMVEVLLLNGQREHSGQTMV